MKILEILNFLNPKNRYPVKTMPSPTNTVRGRFVVDNGDYVDILIYQFDDVWDIAFSRMESFDISGEGDQYKIFNTVFFFLYQLLTTRQKPKFLKFSANISDSTRISLYKKFILRLAPKYFPEFVPVSEQGVDRIFLPKRLKAMDIQDVHTFILKNTQYSRPKI